jgi:hypothetical protein
MVAPAVVGETPSPGMSNDGPTVIAWKANLVVRLRASVTTGHEHPPSVGIQFPVVVYRSLVSLSLREAWRRVIYAAPTKGTSMRVRCRMALRVQLKRGPVKWVVKFFAMQ